MQNRYAGDAGDFGKIGLLRSLSSNDLKVGINWYRVFDEVHNDDGKYTGYLCDPKFAGCDNELLGKLGCIVYGKRRSISTLECMDLIANAVYYNEELLPPQTSGSIFRHQWHENALKKLANTDIVFLDPDNGLLPKSVAQSSCKSIKYIFEKEIIDYYLAGHSVIFYNHRCRLAEDTYLHRFQVFFHCESLCDARSFGIKYVRGTIRDYFFLVHSKHLEQTKKAIGYMLNSNWSLIYNDSLIRNASFNALNYHALKDIALPVVASVIIARFSGYISGNRKYNINFIIVFPIIEEILFRGIILQLLLHVSFLGEKASCVFCGVLFGIMHFQYFGFNKEAAKKVIIAFLGGYYFSIIAVSYGSIIPVIILHMVFNLSAVLFDKNIKHAK